MGIYQTSSQNVTPCASRKDRERRKWRKCRRPFMKVSNKNWWGGERECMLRMLKSNLAIFVFIN